VTFGGDTPEGIESRFPSIGDASTRARATYGRHWLHRGFTFNHVRRAAAARFHIHDGGNDPSWPFCNHPGSN